MSTEPIVLEQRVTPPTAELRLEIPPDLEYFEGHFPGAPVVAGVVQLKWAVEAGRRHVGAHGVLARMENLKFQRVLVPRCKVTLTLEWAEATRKLNFAYARDGERFSSGRLLFRSGT